MIGLLLWVACRKPVAAPPLEALPAEQTPAVVLSGAVIAGVYRDDRWALQVPVPEGWTARPGRDDTPLRFSADHVGTGARVEILALPAGATAPLARAGCAWDFIDTGRYRGLAVPDEVTVATCSPEDPAAPHVFAVLLPREGLTWSLEIAALPQAMVAGKQAGEELLRGVRFEGSGPAPPPAAP